MKNIVTAFALIACGSAVAEPVSPWAADTGATIRLVDAGAGPKPGERLAAIAIRLEPGWKTYWRQPGASGAPPRFDFAASRNVAAATVGFPTPERSAAEDGVTNVYHGAVTFPVIVRPRDPAAPVVLRLAADFGVCETICVPAHAEVSLALVPGGPGGGAAGEQAREALRRLPRAATLGDPGAPAVLSVVRGADRKGAATLDIAVASTDDAPALFAETGEGDYAPAPELDGAPKDGRATFRMIFDEPAPPASGLRLTLASGEDAVETVVPLDAIGPKP